MPWLSYYFTTTPPFRNFMCARARGEVHIYQFIVRNFIQSFFYPEHSDTPVQNW
jgi:hypothetical protein